MTAATCCNHRNDLRLEARIWSAGGATPFALSSFAALTRSALGSAGTAVVVVCIGVYTGASAQCFATAAFTLTAVASLVGSAGVITFAAVFGVGVCFDAAGAALGFSCTA